MSSSAHSTAGGGLNRHRRDFVGKEREGFKTFCRLLTFLECDLMRLLFSNVLGTSFNLFGKK